MPVCTCRAVVREPQEHVQICVHCKVGAVYTHAGVCAHMWCCVCSAVLCTECQVQVQPLSLKGTPISGTSI